ncbi:MAG: oligogalacturonate lyase family protein [Candidatus Latescibacterota bacterium]|nr:oligogalacturonate lyase family protein [Candidatus Latescibacterota bacterium]
MGRGALYPSESRTYRDEQTGVEIRQITAHASIHHHPFYYIPAYDDAMQHLVFVSHRTGRPELFLELRDSGQLLQLTEHAGLAEFSLTPSHDGRHIYFTDSSGAWRVETESCKEEQLASMAEMREKGLVEVAMGTTALSYDDKWWAVPVQVGEVARFVVINTSTGAQEVILERDSIGHPEFHPDDASLLRYAGLYCERMWVVHRDGSDNRLVYAREGNEWIVHETWNPHKRELLTTRWPHGVIGVDIDTGAKRQICSFNAWHPMVSRDGSRMVADTNFPDTGLQVFDPNDGVGAPQLLCLSNASNEGRHWNTDHCPYDDVPVEVYAPQHTHPHPHFSPDGQYVVFTSDRSGFAQLYECRIEP